MKNEELERNNKIEELQDFLDNLLSKLITKDAMRSVSIFKRYLYYIFFSSLLFIMFLFSVIKEIIFLRFKEIRIDFIVLGILDKIIKNHFQIN